MAGAVCVSCLSLSLSPSPTLATKLSPFPGEACSAAPAALAGVMNAVINPLSRSRQAPSCGGRTRRRQTHCLQDALERRRVAGAATHQSSTRMPSMSTAAFRTCEARPLIFGPLICVSILASPATATAAVADATTTAAVAAVDSSSSAPLTLQHCCCTS